MAITENSPPNCMNRIDTIIARVPHKVNQNRQIFLAFWCLREERAFTGPAHTASRLSAPHNISQSRCGRPRKSPLPARQAAAALQRRTAERARVFRGGGGGGGEPLSAAARSAFFRSLICSLIRKPGCVSLRSIIGTFASITAEPASPPRTA